MVKIIAFDLDGTICNTIPLCIESLQKSLTPYTDHNPSREEIMDTFGLNETGMIKKIVKHKWKVH